MTARTRYFVIASLLVLAAGVGTGLVAYYVGLPGGILFSRHGPAELKYVPPDVVLVAYADVRDIMASSVRQRIRRALAGREDGQQEFRSRTGIDIETDIDHVIACLERSDGSDSQNHGMVIARGRFDETKIESVLREHGGRSETRAGKRLIVVPSDGLSPTVGADFAVSFLKPGLLALGSTSLVNRALDLDRGGANVTTNKSVMDLMGSLESGNAWVVGRFDALRTSARLPQGVIQLPAITWFSVSGQIKDGVAAVVRAEARDQEAANNLREVVRGFVALAKLQAGSKPEVQTLLQSLQLGGTGTTVALSISVPAQIFDLIGPPAAPSPAKDPRAH